MTDLQSDRGNQVDSQANVIDNGIGNLVLGVLRKWDLSDK